MSKKIVASIIFSIVISFGFLLIIQNNFPDERELGEREFYSQDLILEEEFIFLMGSSHVGQLNSTLIHEKISKKFSNYVVYNLSYNGDTPSERIQTIDKVMKFNPKIVLYGISYRDFQTNTIEKNPLPDPQQFFNGLVTNKIEGIDKVNPKFTTLEIIRKSLSETGLFPSRELFKLNNSPFFSFTSEQIMIANEEELKQQKNIQEIQNQIGINPEKNNQIRDFNLIIEEFQKKGIKVIIFTTPLHQYSLDQISLETKMNFSDILKDVKNSYNVEVFDFSDRYSDENIWANINHVSYNKKSNVYSNDIAKIILNEIES